MQINVKSRKSLQRQLLWAVQVAEPSGFSGNGQGHSLTDTDTEKDTDGTDMDTNTDIDTDMVYFYQHKQVGATESSAPNNGATESVAPITNGATNLQH
jgi:hypothetical protein